MVFKALPLTEALRHRGTDTDDTVSQKPCTMEQGKEPQFKKIIRQFNENRVRYIIIGRQAVVLYGAPVTSFDYDLWLSSEDRDKAFGILEQDGFEASSEKEDKRPLVTFVNDLVKIDIFFVKAFGKRIDFDHCFRNSVIVKDKDSDFFIRLATPADLITLKSFREPLREKDREDIAYLRKLGKKPL